MLLLWSVLYLIIYVVCVNASLRVTLQQLPDETVRAVVTNFGDQDIKLLKHPNSILRSNQPTHKFTFTSVEGSRLPMFAGIQVSWNPDVAKKIDKAYVTIPARRSINFDHDLSAMYSFSDSGKPQQRFTISLVESTFLTGETLIRFPSPTLTITVSPRRYRIARRNSQQVISPTADSSCSGGQRASLVQSTAYAKGLSAQASRYFENLPDRSERYPTWFGPPSSDRNMFVTGCLSALQDLSFESYNCGGIGCDPDIIAYVTPSRPQWGVTVCDAYWYQTALGADSRPGTLIHEASHLLCGTDDNCYGRSACKALAGQDPDKAVGTASSYMYFVENEPYLF